MTPLYLCLSLCAVDLVAFFIPGIPVWINVVGACVFTLGVILMLVWATWGKS